VVDFADKLEEAAIATVESGVMTGDLLMVAEAAAGNRKVDTEAFIDTIAQNLKKKLS